ncbi:MAG TPA: indole-3-glycerol phosphate synthase TrpC [Micropepsaceae bacterium]|nr:indole-3-glycerol phosphate synthase TrpC [Micropepsaceae bacterium]
MSILKRIAAYKHEEVAAAKKARSLKALMADAGEAPAPRGFRAALEAAKAARRPGLIAEIKKASPSKGVIRADFDPEVIARDYERGGATCLSVLTDTPSFQGAADDLMAARQATHLPVLRKDFMLEPYQIVQSRALGADCILVIMAMLKDSMAGKLIETAKEWDMDALVEVHNERELDRALGLDADLIGINNRDLTTFVTDIGTAIRLKPRVPSSVHVVAESGLSSAEDLMRLAAVGINSYLIGESLMRADDVETATHALLSGVRS